MLINKNIKNIFYIFVNERTENHTLYSNFSVCYRSVYFYVSLVQEQKHQQFISLVLHVKYLFIQYVGLLQRADPGYANDFSEFDRDFSLGHLIYLHYSE